MTGSDVLLRRRRRRPEDAEREILEAADSLLRELPFHEASVNAIMRRTTLARNSFYAYFSDRYTLLLRLFEPLASRFAEAHAMFVEGSGDLISNGRSAMTRVAEIFMEDGALMRALFEASAYDADANRLWREMNDPVVEGFASKIREQIAAGTMVDLDAEATARALIGMDIFCCLEQLVDNPRADPHALTDVLVNIWSRTLLTRDAPAPPPPPARRQTKGGERRVPRAPRR